MNKSSIGRIWFGLLVAIIAILMPTRGILSWNDINGEFTTSWARALNVYCYFTNQSAILVGIVSLMIALKKCRESKIFVVAEFTALICTIVAGTVYYLLLAREEHLHGIAAVNNFTVHAIVPVMYAVGWIVFAEHGKTNWNIVKLSLIFPISWAIFALVRGAIIHWYPYPFMDVDFLGYAIALLNMLVVTMFFVLLFVGAHLLDTKVLAKKGDH